MKKNVVLVDYHNTFRESLALMLEWHTGFGGCLQARSLAEARRVLGDRGRHLDLAIVDLELANGGGFDLIEELRVSRPEVPVLAITRERGPYRRDRALRAGAAEVLTMDASLRELLEGAKRLLGG
jgi:DNA-binding NarL/FixJ family response regulator